MYWHVGFLKLGALELSSLTASIVRLPACSIPRRLARTFEVLVLFETEEATVELSATEA